MKNKGQVIFGWFIILSAGFFGYWIGQGNQQDSQPANDRELQKVIDRGTSSIQSLALAAKTESNNADILLQILNALNDKPVKELPEVRHPMYTLEFKLEDGDVDVPVTFEQVRKDQLEIELGIGSLTSSNLFQAQTLHTILKKIMEKTQSEN